MSKTSPDVVAHREWLTSLVELPTSGKVLDLGCGDGHDLMALAARSPPRVEFLGVDRGEQTITDAQERARSFNNVTFATADLTTAFPWGTNVFDVVFSHNFLECVADVRGLISEVTRVLRPGGQVVFGHWDWDTQVFNAEDKARTRRLVHAFADWQQGWMDHADGWMGRRLRGAFENTGLFHGSVQAHALVNTEYAEPWYGHARAQDFRALAKRGLATVGDVDGFLAEQEELAAARAYCYSITGYAYVGRSGAT